jgi:calcineurin-like phosphoesterase family protein
MKFARLPLIALVSLVIGCKTPPFHEVKVDNPVFIPDTAFLSFEDLGSPKFAALKEKYQLDTVFHGEQNELKRILLLRNWIRSHISINDPGPHPGDGSAESIIDEGLKGHGFHCGHFMVVQNAVMNAYGYVTRCLGAGPGVKGGPDGHHGIDEIWLNSYHKWFLSDAKYNLHFEKHGIPLSALEIRDEYLKNKAADIMLAVGPDRTPVAFYEEYKKSKEDFAQLYTNVEWDKHNDLYTHWPKDGSYQIMFNDDYFKNHTWIWDGKPHWAYNTPHMQLIADRSAIEWTPNTIASNVKIEGDKAVIALHSSTPNLKTYQVRESKEAGWKDTPATLEIPLKTDKIDFAFRAVNLAGVTGPEYRIVLEK